MKYIPENKDYLMHHGIKGQKWGVENGPPYPLNDTVKAVAYRGGLLKDGTQLNVTKRDVAKARKIVNKNMKYMSTQDLQEYKNRLMLEGNIGDITGSNWGQKQVKKLLDSVDRIATQSAVNIGTTMLTKGGLLGITKILENSGVKQSNIKFLTNYDAGNNNSNTKSDTEDTTWTPFGQYENETEYNAGLMNTIQDIFKK